MDKMPNSSSDAAPIKKRVVLLSLIAIVILAIALPIFTPNNTERYNGIERVAAQNALEAVSKSRSGLDGVGTFGTFELKVEDVVRDSMPPTKETLCNSDFIDAAYSSEKNTRFSVTVSLRTIFNIELSRKIVQVCHIDS